MARSPLTLAALATAAVPELDVVMARALSSHGADGGSFEQAVLDVRDAGRMLVRVPRKRTAEARIEAEERALHALSAGVRSRLIFSVPSIAGSTPAGQTRAIVRDFLHGDPVAFGRLAAASPLAASVGRAIAAIHSLPTSFVADSGLPIGRPADALAVTVGVMDRAAATGLVPAALLERWENAAEDAALWQYAPTVVHGSVAADVFIHSADTVTGIVDWGQLGVGDPAVDLSWTLGATVNDATDTVFDAYNQARGSMDRQVRKRATLYAELEIAKWLLHGTDERSTEIVDDAIAMLHNLVDVVQYDLNRTIDTDTRPVLSVDEVEAMLNQTDRRF